MNEIKKTLATLKARWPEVTLIILLFSLGQITKWSNNFPELKTLFPVAGLLFLLIFFVLQFGFLRTVYLENDKRQSIRVLFQTGKRFFWRMTGFSLLLLVPMLAGFFVFKMMFGDTFIKWSMWYFIGCPLILIKIWLLVPAMIIVFDIGVFESFKKLKQYKLLNAKPLVFLFLIQLISPLVLTFIARFISVTVFTTIMFKIIHDLVYSFLFLMIAVTAVRFVAPVNLTNEQSL